MIVIIGLGILAAAVIGVTADSLGSRAHLAEAAELTDSAPTRNHRERSSRARLAPGHRRAGVRR